MILNKLEWDNLKHAASKDDSKIHLCGLYINVKDRQVATTNGHKLCIINIAEDRENPLNDMDITRNVLIEIPRISLKTFEEVRLMDLDGKIIAIHLGNKNKEIAQYTCVELDLEYPEYQRVVPIEDPYLESCPGQGITNIILCPDNLPIRGNVQMIFNKDSVSPVLCKINEKTGKRLTWVFMPMRRA